MSEADTSKDIFFPYLEGVGLNMGFGGSALGVPGEITFDMPQAYTSVGSATQILRGDAMNIPFICDDAVSWIHASHLTEDWSYGDNVAMMKEWRRVLKPGGFILINGPDQVKFEDHCRRTGQGLNAAHVERDYSLNNFKSKVLPHCGNWRVVYENDSHGPYSFLIVIQKI